MSFIYTFRYELFVCDPTGFLNLAVDSINTAYILLLNIGFNNNPIQIYITPSCVILHYINIMLLYKYVVIVMFVVMCYYKLVIL